ncbi:MAG: type VI secretion system tip protein VgrG [Bacteroidota bacterium]
MPSSPVVAIADLITYTVKVNGSAVDSTVNVHTISIENRINRIPVCELELLDGSPDSEDFPISDGSTFVPGNTIDIELGYENTNTTIFSGIIVKHAIRIHKESGPVLVITCKDKAVKMTKVRKNAYYTNKKDSDILSSVIGTYGLSADVGATSVQQKEVIQFYATDWDFMLARADINGMIAIVNNGKISLKTPDSLTATPLVLTYGVDIFEFEGEVDAESQYSSVKASAWDMKGQSMLSQTAAPSNFSSGNLTTSALASTLGVSPYVLQSSGFMETDMLQSWAKAKAIKTAYSKLQGHVQFQGSALAVPGTQLELKGVGARFNGSGFVTGITHRVADGNWITTAELGLVNEWFTTETKVESPLAAGLLPGVQGLQIGVVKQIDQDPDHEFRVKIDLPLVGTGGEGVWARLGNCYASSGFGAFIFPEVNDEVIVGFFNDDPRYPVILGSLYSSGRAPAFTPDDQNNTKAFVTRTKMKVEFQEDKGIITITTPKNNKAVLSDDAQSIELSDQNSNSITMSSSGIEIKSASAVNIKAATEMNLSATSGGTYKVSGGDLSMQGLNMSCDGQLSFKAQGAASAQLTASGEVKVQGAIVMIN